MFCRLRPQIAGGGLRLQYVREILTVEAMIRIIEEILPQEREDYLRQAGQQDGESRIRLRTSNPDRPFPAPHLPRRC